jgi:hypothetical protein
LEHRAPQLLDNSTGVLDSHMTDLDIWRSANILLKRYGVDAMLIATRRADALFDQGDVQGCSAWIRISRAIASLERKRAGGDTVH